MASLQLDALDPNRLREERNHVGRIRLQHAFELRGRRDGCCRFVSLGVKQGDQALLEQTFDLLRAKHAAPNFSRAAGRPEVREQQANDQEGAGQRSLERMPSHDAP